MDADLERSSLVHIVRLMNSRLKGPKRIDDKSAVAILKKGDWHERRLVTEGKPAKRSDKNTPQLGCVLKSSSILRKSSDMQKPIQLVKFTKAVARHAYIRDQNPSLGYICPGEPHQRSPNDPKFEDRSRRRQSGKSKVPAKQRGSWPKVC